MRISDWSSDVCSSDLGYDQRRLLVPATSVLAVLDGSKDESYYLFMTAGRELDADSTLGLSGFVNYFDNGALGAADIQSAGLSASYSRRLWRSLTGNASAAIRSEEHTSELQSLMRLSYAVFCLNKKTNLHIHTIT